MKKLIITILVPMLLIQGANSSTLSTDELYTKGVDYFIGRNVTEDKEKGLELIIESARKGSINSKVLLGIMHLNEEGHSNKKEISKWLSEPEVIDSYDQIDFTFTEEDQRLFAHAFLLGEKFNQDAQTSLKWFEKAAENGDSNAQRMLGMFYYHGESATYFGTQIAKRDYHKAVQWLRKAADQGDPWAYEFLGNSYLNGFGVRQNVKTAKEHFGKACDLGVQSGCEEYAKLNSSNY